MTVELSLFQRILLTGLSGVLKTMSNFLVIVQKTKAQLTQEEQEALKKISESSNFYRLSLTFEQHQKFWDWFNSEIKQQKQENPK